MKSSLSIQENSFQNWLETKLEIVHSSNDNILKISYYFFSIHFQFILIFDY